MGARGGAWKQMEMDGSQEKSVEVDMEVDGNRWKQMEVESKKQMGKLPLTSMAVKLLP